MMHFETNPFEKKNERRDSSLEHDLLVEEALFEHEYLYGAPKLPTEVEDRAKVIKKAFPELKKEYGPLDYYAGVSWHELGNAHRSAFLVHLETEAKERKIPMINLTEKDVDEIYQSFPDKQTLEGEEDRALSEYARSTRNFWKTKRQDSVDAQTLSVDLEDRVARTRLNGAEREVARRRDLKALERIIDNMPMTGRQSELKLLYILRKVALDREVGHLISVEHGLPREDLAVKKIDLHLILGAMDVALQVKSEVTRDEYREEHYEQVRAKASAAIEEEDTRLAIVDTEHLEAAYRYWGKDGGETKGEKIAGTRAKNEILQMIEDALTKKAAGIFSLLKDRKKKEAPPSGKRIDRNFLERNSGIPVLVALGLVSASSLDATAVREAKELLSEKMPVVSKVFGSQEAFLERDPEKVARLRSALGL